jgi:hypothetical protein
LPPDAPEVANVLIHAYTCIACLADTPEITLARKSKMICTDFFHHNEFNKLRAYNPYASETALLRMENAFSNFRNEVSGPGKKRNRLE